MGIQYGYNINTQKNMDFLWQKIITKIAALVRDN